MGKNQCAWRGTSEHRCTMHQAWERKAAVRGARAKGRRASLGDPPCRSRNSRPNGTVMLKRIVPAASRHASRAHQAVAWLPLALCLAKQHVSRTHCDLRLHSPGRAGQRTQRPSARPPPACLRSRKALTQPEVNAGEELRELGGFGGKPRPDRGPDEPVRVEAKDVAAAGVKVCCFMQAGGEVGAQAAPEAPAPAAGRPGAAARRPPPRAKSDPGQVPAALGGGYLVWKRECFSPTAGGGMS